MKIFIYTENLLKPFDEGIKKACFYIIDYLSRIAAVRGACRWGNPLSRNSFEVIPSNRLLLSKQLRSAIRDFNPHLILYIPTSCGTFASFLRMKVLDLYHQESRSFMIILQPKKLGLIHKKLIRFMKPDQVLTPSPEVISQMSEIKIPVVFFPLFVDQKKFKPLLSAQLKKELRKKYGFPLDKFIILHVGHINRGRNLEALIPLQKDDHQVLFVGSSSTEEHAPRDESLKKTLIEKGIRIIDDYIEHIEEIYQLSDVYVFPTFFEGGCISIPLSVLEARASGLPVVTTPFGGLPLIIPENERGFVYSDPNKFPSQIERIRRGSPYQVDSASTTTINEMFCRTLLQTMGIKS